MEEALIAPCGLNCNICRYHLRAKKPCPGCRADAYNKSAGCTTCPMKNCAELMVSGRYDCADCLRFPCALVVKLDKRYRTQWGASPIRNLGEIHESGMEGFLTAESTRWKCTQCGGQLSMHFWQCPNCGGERMG